MSSRLTNPFRWVVGSTLLLLVAVGGIRFWLHAPIPSTTTNSDEPSVNDSRTVSPERLIAGTSAGQEWDGNGLTMKFCWCPDEGFVTLGGPEKDDQVVVGLTGFWLGKYEVTQSEWRDVMGTDVEEHAEKAIYDKELAGVGHRFPMYYVTHDEATEFCRRLTARERTASQLPAGWEYRLPTDTQWEYACRAGTMTETAFGDDLSSHQANFNGRFPHKKGTQVGPLMDQPFLEHTTVVGSYLPNRWGLYDMHGNVAEWCRDWYGQQPRGDDPEAVDVTSVRVIRGGCYHDSGWNCTSASRRGLFPEDRFADTGFRVAAVRVPK
jgi:formylglycine-generating enzyme required for sulfatase activity